MFYFSSPATKPLCINMHFYVFFLKSKISLHNISEKSEEKILKEKNFTRSDFNRPKM